MFGKTSVIWQFKQKSSILLPWQMLSSINISVSQRAVNSTACLHIYSGILHWVRLARLWKWHYPAHPPLPLWWRFHLRTVGGKLIMAHLEKLAKNQLTIQNIFSELYLIKTITLKKTVTINLVMSACLPWVALNSNYAYLTVQVRKQVVPSYCSIYKTIEINDNLQA